MSNEVENQQDLSTEGSDASIDKIEDETNSSEDSQPNLSIAVPKDDSDSVKDYDKETEDAEATVDKANDASEVNDIKENLKKDDDSDLKNNIDEKESKEESRDKEDGDIENDDDDADEEESTPKAKEETAKLKEETSKKVVKKSISSTNKSSEQFDTKKKPSKTKVIEDTESKQENTDTVEGKGMQLGEIPRIDASISRFKNDDLKLLYRLLFKTPGKTALIAKSIKKFNGFGFKKDSEEYTKKIELTKKFELKQLKSICEMLDLEKKGTKDEIVERIIDFLVEPKDSVKQAGGGRPKRTAAVRANNRGYSSHDDSYSSDERRASRGGRGKGKRSNLKDDTTSESDEEFHLSDSSDTQFRSKKRTKPTPKPVSDEEDISEADDHSSDESDAERKKRKTKKVVNSKPKPKVPPGRKGRKSAAESERRAAPTSKKPAGRKRAYSEESDATKDENASSSEDEPLIKKTKSPQPPTDEEIKKYVKEILDGANLEEITMKTVCKQVYAHYPDFDLAHKKDFIKATVKSLIST